MNTKYDDGLTSQQRWMYATIGFMTAGIFPVLAVLYTVAAKAVSSLDARTIALGQFLIPLPMAIFVSYKIYVTKLQPIVAKIIEVRQKRLLDQKERR